MINKFNLYFKTATFKHSLISFLGVFTNGLLGLAFYAVAIRYLAPEKYGILAISITVLTLIADIGDLGTNTGLVRFVGKHIGNDKQIAFRFLKLGLEIKLIVGGLIAVFGILFSSLIATVVFKKPELTGPLQFAFLGAFFFLLFSFLTTILQAFQKFRTWSGIQISTNFTRLILLCLLVFLGINSLDNVLILYITIPLFGFLFGTFIFVPKDFLKVNNERRVLKDFFKYNRWVAVFTLVVAVSSRLDTFITARLLTTEQTGIYAAANQLVAVVPQIVGALGVVLAPKMASFTNTLQLSTYIRKVLLMSGGISTIILVGGLVGVVFIPYIFGSAYMQTGAVFIVLLLSMLVFFVALPFHSAIFYYFAHPKLFVWIAIGHFLIVSLVGWNLISIYGVMGAAFTVLIGQVFNLVVPAIWVYRKL